MVKMINIHCRRDPKAGKSELLLVADETGAAISFDQILPTVEGNEVMQFHLPEPVISINPLEWTRDGETNIARSIIGVYSVVDGRWSLNDGEPSEKATDNQAAMKAAQDHFESVVKSVIA